MQRKPQFVFAVFFLDTIQKNPRDFFQNENKQQIQIEAVIAA